MRIGLVTNNKHPHCGSDMVAMEQRLSAGIDEVATALAQRTIDVATNQVTKRGCHRNIRGRKAQAG